MSKNIFPVNGEAMPGADRSAIMKRAWAIFRSSYGDSRHALKRGHRKASFGYCLMLAWQGAKADAARATQDAVAARVAELRGAIEIEHMAENWRGARAGIATMRAELSRLT